MHFLDSVSTNRTKYHEIWAVIKNQKTVCEIWFQKLKCELALKYQLPSEQLVKKCYACVSLISMLDTQAILGVEFEPVAYTKNILRLSW